MCIKCIKSKISKNTKICSYSRAKSLKTTGFKPLTEKQRVRKREREREKRGRERKRERQRETGIVKKKIESEI